MLFHILPPETVVFINLHYHDILVINRRIAEARICAQKRFKIFLYKLLIIITILNTKPGVNHD